ncbi:hypothetical protein ACFQ0B_22100 [Nonomuraea thailandensis]
MADEPLELGEMSFSEWYAHTDKMAEVGFLTIARKLPSLIGQAMRMAWRASPRDTAAAVVLNLLGGVFTAFGLLATTGVLTALFSEGPTPAASWPPCPASPWSPRRRCCARPCRPARAGRSHASTRRSPG